MVLVVVEVVAFAQVPPALADTSRQMVETIVVVVGG
jgi:hypothetical protein